MTPLPSKYAWLAKEPAPRLLKEAVALYGTQEVPGPASNPSILQWAKNLGGWIASWYKNDDTPWCGLFMAEVCRRAGLPVVKEPLRAISWANWGSPARVAKLGDVLVFQRPGGGHVGIYVGEDADCYHVLGGNQGNAVTITRIEKPRTVAIRRTIWAVREPDNIRIIPIKATDPVSTNEA